MKFDGLDKMKINLDKIGMISSQICGIHCFLMPFLFAMFPFAGIAFAKGELFEWGFIGFSFSLAAFAMTQGFISHGKWYPTTLASVGFIILIYLKLKFEHGHETFSGSFIFILPGILVFMAHFFNHKFLITARCRCDHESHPQNTKINHA